MIQIMQKIYFILILFDVKCNSSNLTDEFAIKKQVENTMLEYFDGYFVKSKENDGYIQDFKNFEREGTEEYYFDNKSSSFIYKAYSAKMNSILQKLNNKNKSFENLKSVRIYTTHLLTFDVNYKISKERYASHSPNLIIISPIVNFESHITIDLSCENVPGFPDNKLKAENGYPGKDGKPGLSGYNSGNCFILANNIIIKNNVYFISEGGQGGSGQNGKKRN